MKKTTKLEKKLNQIQSTMLLLNLQNGVNHLEKIPNFLGLDMSQQEESLLGEEKENFVRKRGLISKEEKNTKESIFKNQVLKSIGFLEKSPIVQQEKIIASVGHAEKQDIMQMNAKIGRIISSLKPQEAQTILRLAKKKHQTQL